MENVKKGTIVIDLSRSNDPMSHLENDYHQLIQKDAWEAIHKRISEAAGKVRDLKDKASYHSPLVKDRHHTTLAVLGRRGDGKSTFVLNVLDAYYENGVLKRDEGQADKVKVMPLPIIDGTLMETGEHPFLYVISAVKDCVCKYMSGSVCGKSKQVFEEEWVKSFRKLAVGLNALGTGTASLRNEHWENDQYVMEKGLEAATGGMRLAEHFSNFLKASLEVLGRNMFLLAFDDVDTHFEEGEKITETIRRYLSSPYLQVILTCDPELLTSLVRKKQWSMLGELPAKDGRDYSVIVKDLEDQYILKLFKTENRIYLNTLDEISILHDVSVLEYGKTKVPEVINNLLRKYFYVNDVTNIEICRRLLLRMPMRTLIQFLKIVHKRDEEKLDDMSFCIAMTQLSLSKMMDYHIDLYTNVHLNGFDRLAFWLEKMDSWENGTALLPTREGTGKDFLFLVLGAIHAVQLTPKPSMLFNYLINISMMNEWLSIRNEREPKIYLKQIIQPEARHSFRNMLNSTVGENRSRTEIVRITRRKEVDGSLTPLQKIILKLALVKVRNRDETHEYLSLFSLLATLSDLAGMSKDDISEHFKSLDPTVEGESIDEDKLDDLLIRLCNWLKEEAPKIPIVLYHKIWKRLSKTLKGMENSKPGEVMHRSIVAFLNSVLVEESLHFIEKPARINNATNNDKYFIENANGYQQKKHASEMMLFEWLWRCPLWGYFLQNSTGSETVELNIKQGFIGDAINIDLLYDDQKTNKHTPAHTPIYRKRHEKFVIESLKKNREKVIEIMKKKDSDYHEKVAFLIREDFDAVWPWKKADIEKYSKVFDKWYESQQ